MDNTYNGWKNRQTWNVALWIQNDESMYRSACEFMRKRVNNKGVKGVYASFIRKMGMQQDRTPDNIAWLGSRLDHKSLNEMMLEL